MKGGLPFVQDLSLENSTDSYNFDWLYFTQCLTSFFSMDYLVCLYAWFLILFHLPYIDEVLSINPSTSISLFCIDTDFFFRFPSFKPITHCFCGLSFFSVAGSILGNDQLLKYQHQPELLKKWLDQV